MIKMIAAASGGGSVVGGEWMDVVGGEHGSVLLFR